MKQLKTYLQLYEQPQDNSWLANEDSDYTTRPWATQTGQQMDRSQDAAIIQIFPIYHVDQSTNTP